jgi:hypothetical protein
MCGGEEDDAHVGWVEERFESLSCPNYWHLRVQGWDERGMHTRLLAALRLQVFKERNFVAFILISLRLARHKSLLIREAKSYEKSNWRGNHACGVVCLTLPLDARFGIEKE